MRAVSICVVLASVLIAACAIRLGGPKPEEYRTLALGLGDAASPATVADRIRSAGANVVVLSARADSAWFGEVARASSLELSGPGDAGPVALAFLAGPALGDTTIALPVEGDEPLVVHDALYAVDENRYLDLLAMRIESPQRARRALGAFLAYVATDVMHQAAVVLAVDVPTPAVGDSVAALLMPAFTDVHHCLPGASGRDAAPAASPGMRLLYGPEVRIRCESARILDGDAAAIVARLIVGR